MLLLYKLLYLTFFHYSLYLPMMRRERKRSVTKLAYLTVWIASVLSPFLSKLDTPPILSLHYYYYYYFYYLERIGRTSNSKDQSGK